MIRMILSSIIHAILDQVKSPYYALRDWHDARIESRANGFEFWGYAELEEEPDFNDMPHIRITENHADDTSTFAPIRVPEWIQRIRDCPFDQLNKVIQADEAHVAAFEEAYASAA